MRSILGREKYEIYVYFSSISNEEYMTLFIELLDDYPRVIKLKWLSKVINYQDGHSRGYGDLAETCATTRDL